MSQLPVFVINETLARQAFPGVDPIGKRIRLPYMDASPRFAQVVGVVADLRYAKLGTATEPELFMDYAHASMAGATLTMRTSTDPMSVAPSIRTLLSTIDRTQPLFDVKPLDVALADSIAPRRLTLLLLGTFALSALLLVIVGIYGVVRMQSRSEHRRSASASRSAPLAVRVVMMVVRQGMAVTIGGIALGLAAAFAVDAGDDSAAVRGDADRSGDVRGGRRHRCRHCLRRVLAAGSQGIPHRSTRRTSMGVRAPRGC